MGTNLKLAVAFVLASSIASPPSLAGQMVENVIGGINPTFKDCVTQRYDFARQAAPDYVDSILGKAFVSYSIRMRCLGWE